MFTIYTQPSKNATLRFIVDGPKSLAVPPVHIVFGKANKAKAYREWLQLSFNENSALINFLAQIFDKACEYGHLHLFARSNTNKYMVEGLKSFYTENEETLKTIIPYLKQGMTMQKKNNEDLTDEEKAIQANSNNMTLADLPESDRNQLIALMQLNDVDPEVTEPPVSE